MLKKRRIKTNILSPETFQKYNFKKNVVIEFDQKIRSISENATDDIQDYTDYICIPGFIDTHVHLSQLNIKGKHSSNLLDWLNDYVFEEESKSRDDAYAANLSRKFYEASVKQGTTCSVIYTAAFKSAAEIAFQIASEMGFRAFIGKTQMDVNCPPSLQENPQLSMQESVDLYEKWDNKNDLLNYIFTPRFAPACTSELMKEVGKFIQDNNAYLQTHLSENKNEIAWVKSLYPTCCSYTEVYRKHGLLGPRTLLAHCIHLDEAEMNIISQSKSKITHCPDSNFFLKSGAFPLEKIREHGIEFALASDVGAGTSLSMMNVMKMMNYRQDDYVVSPVEAFYYATLAGAEILSIADKTGSIEIDKAADLVFLKINDLHQKSEIEILSDLLYLGDEVQVKETIIAGKTLYSQPL